MVISKNGHNSYTADNPGTGRRNRASHGIPVLGSTITAEQLNVAQKNFRSELQWQKKRSEYKREELLGGSLSKQLKKHMVKVLVWTVTLCASDDLRRTWTLRNDDVTRLEAYERENFIKATRCGFVGR